jgi:epoxyqueuosine reductase
MDGIAARISTSSLKRQAAERGFDLCGIAPVAPYRELKYLREWLDQGYAGEMSYLHRTAEKRMDVRHVLSSARTVISLGTVYDSGHPYSTGNTDKSRAALARYAWGDDYHVVIQQRLDALVSWMRSEAGEGFEARAYVDTGPVQERVYAQQAGIGWIGKNTCLINAERGSWIFLSEIICNLDLEVDVPATDQCGACTRCLDACPTGALIDAHVLDSTRCLSYLTIELKGSIPAAHRDTIGEHAYGCDICQEVCPWNLGPAETSPDMHWQPRRGLDGPRLIDLWLRTDDELRGLLRGSAMKRAGVRRLRRNLATAIGNSGDPTLASALEAHAEETCVDEMVREHVMWAVEKLRGETPED